MLSVCRVSDRLSVCLSVCLSSAHMHRRYAVVDILCSLSVVYLSVWRKVHILECLCAEPLKKTMVLVEDDGTAFVVGERIANVTGEKVVR